MNANGGSTLSSFAYTYDPVGNPTQVTTADGLVTYGYDNRDRLVEACYQASCPGGSDPFIRYAYDAVGNRATETRPSGTTAYTYDASDELTQTSGPGGTIAYSYDHNGNETQAGSRSFAYDLANRIASTSSGGTTTSYAYDGDRNRLTTTTGGSTTSYVWDLSGSLPQLALERDGSGSTLRSYLYGNGLVSMDAGGSTYYFHRDGLGSIVNLTSTGGAAEWSYAYEPYGSARTTTQNDPSAPANPIRFAGEFLDSATGLYDLRARQYDPATGRFLSLDPLARDSMSPGLSSYVYADAQPTSLVDPSGMGAVGKEDCGGFLGNLRCVHDWFGPWFIENQIGWRPGCLNSTKCLLWVEFNVLSMVSPQGRAGRAFTEDQQALVALAKAAKSRGGVKPDEAATLEGWSKEVGLSFRGPETHPNRPGPVSQQPHIHVGPVNHIPVNP